MVRNLATPVHFSEWISLPENFFFPDKRLNASDTIACNASITRYEQEGFAFD